MLTALYLTPHRAYDPVSGRWLLRDPIGESSDAAGILCRYVLGNPISLTDPFGPCGTSCQDLIRLVDRI